MPLESAVERDLDPAKQQAAAPDEPMDIVTETDAEFGDGPYPSREPSWSRPKIMRPAAVWSTLVTVTTTGWFT